MVDQNLENSILFVGDWFLPGSDNKVPGVFCYDQGRLYLDLLDRLTSEKSVKTLHGDIRHAGLSSSALSSKGKKANRVRYITARRSVTLTDVDFEHGLSCTVGAAILGNMLDDNHYVEGISFDFDILCEWAISKHNTSELDGSIEETIQKFTKLSETFEFGCDKVTCTLNISPAINCGQFTGKSQSYRSNFTIKTKKNMRLWDVVDYVRYIQCFLKLVMGRNLNLTRMNLLETGETKYVFIPVSKKPVVGSESSHLVELGHIRKNFTCVMNEWFIFYANNKDLIDSFINTMNEPYVERVDFFAYASLLEGYAKYKDRTVPTYFERIQNVLRCFESDFTNLNEFACKIHNMRNNIFHADQNKTIDTGLVLDITHDLFFLIRIVLLNEVGLNLTINSIQCKIDFKFLKRKSIS